LLQRPWLGRLWIIQEVLMVLNARLFCGSQTCTWESISRIVLFIRQHGLLDMLGTSLGINTAFVMARLKEEIRQNRLDGLDYLRLLKPTRPFFSIDPRYRFFALHGFLSNDNTDGIHIDYSLSCQQVYQSWAMYSTVNKENLELLSLISTG
jgi:hypothetical protein